jgi:hypothetical protein
MTTKAKIKVIKKGEIKKNITPETKVIKSKKASGREMVSTVSNWVTDFQTRKREETKIAIEKFFSNHPQTNGV